MIRTKAIVGSWLVAFTAVAYTYGHVDNSDKINDNVIVAAISSVHAEGKILVLSAKLHSAIESERFGRLTDEKVNSEEDAHAEFTVDLAKIDSKNLHVASHILYVDIPKELITYTITDPVNITHKDNGSFGFIFTPKDRKDLSDHNEVVLRNMISNEAKSMLPVSYDPAASQIRALFNIPIRASGSTLDVQVNIR